MTAIYTQLSNALIKMHGEPPYWSVKCYGNTILGGGQDRPIMVRNGMVQYASLAFPVYGTNQGWNFANTAQLTVTATAVGAPASLMTGVVSVREAIYRESTGERSWVGDSREIDLGVTPSQITVASNSWAYYDRNVTHRVFYVNFVDSLGVYYEAGRCDYTTFLADSTDSVTINVSPDQIIKNRELETKQQTLIFPAGTTGCFWKGRIWAANLQPRDFAAGTTLTFTQGSNIVQINETSPGVYPDFWKQSDLYKGIVDRNTNEIVAFVERINNNTQVRVRLPEDIRDISVWDDPTVTLTNIGLSGDMSNIYSTPIYAGGTGGAIVYGIMTWCPLDTLQDEGFYASGSSITKLVTAGDDMAVIYNNGIGMYSGDVSAGSPPSCRHFVLARNVGALNPDAVWQASDGSLWFQGSGRIYRVQAGQVIDMSANMGITGFWEKNVEKYGEGLRRYDTAFNPQRNMALMVNVPKRGEGTGTFGMYSMALCHDSMTIHPIRWHEFTRFASIHCLQHDNGDWQFYGGTGNSEIYKVMVRDQKFDRREDIVVPVKWHYTTGVLWAQGTVYTVAVRFMIETSAEFGIAIEVGIDTKNENWVSADYTMDKEVDISQEQLKRLEWVPMPRLSGYGIQYKIRGETGVDFKLIGMTALEDYQKARGFD